MLSTDFVEFALGRGAQTSPEPGAGRQKTERGADSVRDGRVHGAEASREGRAPQICRGGRLAAGRPLSEGILGVPKPLDLALTPRCTDCLPASLAEFSSCRLGTSKNPKP